VAVALWLFVNRTKIGKISAQRPWIGTWWAFGNQCELGLRPRLRDRLLPGRFGRALVAPTVSITLGMDHTLIIEAFLIVTIGGLGNMWGALVAR